jgi:hypothetical protein
MSEAARHSSRDDNPAVPQPTIAILSAESLRSGSSTYPSIRGAKADERISLFWRIFGGTLLSLAGLVGITVYQQFNSGLNELHSELSRINEGRADLVKKDEFAARNTSIWNGIKDLQTATNSLAAVREHEALLEQRMKAAEDERKEMTKEIQLLRERLATLEGKSPSPAPTRQKGELP